MRKCAYFNIGTSPGGWLSVFCKTAGRDTPYKGYVRNLPDGSVEVVAEGSRDALDSFIKDLALGPDGGNIRDCQVNWRPITRLYQDFTLN